MTGLLVVHDLPGRVRLRVPADGTTDGLSDAMLREPGVVGCTWSPRTRSLLVRYRSEDTDVGTVTATTARLTGVEVGESPTAAPSPAVGGPGPAVSLRDAARVLDEGVQQATRGVLDLGGLIPLALVTWAVAEIVRGRTGPLTWSTAL